MSQVKECLRCVSQADAATHEGCRVCSTGSDQPDRLGEFGRAEGTGTGEAGVTGHQFEEVDQYRPAPERHLDKRAIRPKNRQGPGDRFWCTRAFEYRVELPGSLSEVRVEVGGPPVEYVVGADLPPARRRPGERPIATISSAPRARSAMIILSPMAPIP